jgi:hypothetical protein
MEQRIQTLEEEVKLLKNQIRSVLLDIKESLASGDWQLPARNGEAAGGHEETALRPAMPEGKPDAGAESRTGTVGTVLTDRTEEKEKPAVKAEAAGETGKVRQEEYRKAPNSPPAAGSRRPVKKAGSLWTSQAGWSR